MRPPVLAKGNREGDVPWPFSSPGPRAHAAARLGCQSCSRLPSPNAPCSMRACARWGPARVHLLVGAAVVGQCGDGRRMEK